MKDVYRTKQDQIMDRAQRCPQGPDDGLGESRCFYYSHFHSFSGVLTLDLLWLAGKVENPILESIKYKMNLQEVHYLRLCKSWEYEDFIQCTLGSTNC